MSQVLEDKSKPYLTPLIKRIRAHIISSGVPLKAVSAKAGISEGRFYRLMDGSTRMTADEVELLCNIEGLEMNPNEIFSLKNS
ncbi:hypothetical protein ABGV40_15010 [Paenibacillus amylolyticus]|uniref:hypothetical protein n=1 Tax=Paenibacillus amylolyticus TaxID=1451 RepID=UPI0032428E6C